MEHIFKTNVEYDVNDYIFQIEEKNNEFVVAKHKIKMIICEKYRNGGNRILYFLNDGSTVPDFNARDWGTEEELKATVERLNKVNRKVLAG